MGTNKTEVIHGGSGNDTIYAGADYYGTGGGNNGKVWLYGDEGDDEIWSKMELDAEYLWGGADDDRIYGGYGATLSILNGNEGNDYIWPGYYGDNADENPAGVLASNIRGGKGHDVINATRLNDAGDNFQPDIKAPDAVAANLGGGKAQGINWQGGAGDDTIWGNDYGALELKLYGN